MAKHLPLILLCALALTLSGCSRCGKSRARADVDLGAIRVEVGDEHVHQGHPHGGPPGLRNHPHGGPPGQTRRGVDRGREGEVEVEVEIRN